MPNFPTIAGFSGTLGDALGASKIGPPQIGGVDYLKIDFETGNWLCGQEGDDVSGDLVIINTNSIQHGWITWSGQRPHKMFVSFVQELPMAPAPIGQDMPDEARSMCGSFADDGGPFQFDTSSYGGRKGVDVLLAEIKAHAATGSQHLYPKCKLSNESYANKQRGGKLVFNPVFEVVAWCDVDGNEEGGKAKAVTKQETKAEPAAETEPEAVDAPAEPVRRRRRAPAA
jgi:hypothetical protein